jgi:monofunctional biosynthetic peptidoglycan transglycosylase
MPRKSAKSAGGIRWWGWALIVLIVAAVFPIIQVVCLRFSDPSVTPLMILRQTEGRWTGKTSQQRQYTWRPVAQIPRNFLKFVLIAEDQRFFRHHGFDWKEIEAATAQAERSGQPARGASTITQQCARSLFLWQGRSWVRKGLEAYYTFWMEAFLSKRRILELYANVVEMGDGVYGIEAAAQAHYHADAQALTRDQCAALAAILPNPRFWDPRAPNAEVSARIAKILRQEKQVHFPLGDK